jgi:hypothetical protein
MIRPKFPADTAREFRLIESFLLETDAESF